MNIHEDWKLINNHHYEREWGFPDFATALDFVNKIGAVCEEMNHHAEITLGWGKVMVKIWSHDTNGISPRDLILCESIDRLE